MTDNNNSDFETAAEILSTINLQYNDEYENKVEKLFSCWSGIVGESLAKFSNPRQFSSDGILFIKCSNSVVANEIFSIRTEINKKLKEEAKKIALDGFKYIRITYN